MKQGVEGDIRKILLLNCSIVKWVNWPFPVGYLEKFNNPFEFNQNPRG